MVDMGTMIIITKAIKILLKEVKALEIMMEAVIARLDILEKYMVVDISGLGGRL